MLKQRKNFGINIKKIFHNKYIALVVYKQLNFKRSVYKCKSIKSKLLFKNKKIRLKIRLIRFRKTLVLLKPLKLVFNSIYNPRHFSYFKILYAQKKQRRWLRLYKRLVKLIQLKKLKSAARLRIFLIKNKKLKKKILYSVTITIRRNNIFSTISKSLKCNKLIFARSAGLYKLQLSKKTFKFKSRYFLNKFFNDLKKHLKPKFALKRYYRLINKGFKKTKKRLSRRKEWKKRLAFVPRISVYAKIVAPKRMRKSLIVRFLRLYKTNRYLRSIVLNVIEKKIFNGCRPKKKRRKKRQGLRVFK
ncbi:hypothetical protein [Phenylobacterium aquaticum]|uniref:hypothetical protein n=1 Tax=Phenylobacterium aquaticum TaxID=1763816 RepID=UPI0026EAF202|nr:hypothetical protein [Phenylobacterium aquaticum]